MSEAETAPIRFDPNARGPLDGVRVLDLSRLVAGNMLSLQLADFGADVIKVEPPSGDPLRDWRDNGHSLHWKTYARNKRSIALNLRHDSAKDVLLRLAAKADVFIENFRPGTLEEIALGPDVLLENMLSPTPPPTGLTRSHRPSRLPVCGCSSRTCVAARPPASTWRCSERGAISWSSPMPTPSTRHTPSPRWCGLSTTPTSGSRPDSPSTPSR
jgi:hypothetical protein